MEADKRFFGEILSMPQTVRELTAELRRLNDNLESFQTDLPKIRESMETAADLRTMLAPLLGYRVVDKKE